MIAVVSRLSSQKGLDLLLDALPAILGRGAQLVLQGSGEPVLESAFRNAAAVHPLQVAVRIGYDEQSAHQIIAGADAVLLPSRYEPCGLTQLYALRYGSIPIVRRVGGLADSVVDASDSAIDDDLATGFSFDHATPSALEEAVRRAHAVFGQPERWRQLMRRAMAQEFSWRGAARQYGELYQRVQAARLHAAGSGTR